MDLYPAELFKLLRLISKPDVMTDNPNISEYYNHVVNSTGFCVLKSIHPLNRIGGSSQFTLSQNLQPELKPKRKPKPVYVQPIKTEKPPRTYTVNKKQVRQRIYQFVRTQEGRKKMYFWTISFPLGLSDSWAYRIFNIFLTRMRRDLNLKAYLWIAERQGNGTIHYHLAVHQYINVQRANKFMRASLMSIHKSNPDALSNQIVKSYNGVDIAKNRKTGRVVNFAKKSRSKVLANYISKYVTKSTAEFPHLAWHCSREYSSLAICVRISFDEAISYGFYEAVNLLDRYEHDHFIYYRFTGDPPRIFQEILSEFNSSVHRALNFSVN